MIRDFYAQDIPKDLLDALQAAREVEQHEKHVHLHPIPAAIAWISPEEWRASIDRIESLITKENQQ